MKNIKTVLWDWDGIFIPHTNSFYKELHRAVASFIATTKGDNYDQALKDARQSQRATRSCFHVFQHRYDMDFEDIAKGTYPLVDLDRIVKPDKQLKKNLLHMNKTHAILTHADMDWTLSGVKHLGLEEVFPKQRILPLAGTPQRKTMAETYRSALATLGFRANETGMVEDTQSHLEAAKDAGLTTFLLNALDMKADYTDYQFKQRHHLIRALYRQEKPVLEQ